MSKTYMITFDSKLRLKVNTQLEYLLDTSPARFFDGTKDGEKYFINKERILYFKEYNKKTDEPIGKQF